MRIFAARDKFVLIAGLSVLISGAIYATTQNHNDIIILNLFLCGSLITFIGYKMSTGPTKNESASRIPILNAQSKTVTQSIVSFEKIQEIISHVGGFSGYLLMRTLKHNNDISTSSDAELMEHVILSKYHFWGGEKEPQGVSWNYTDVNGHRHVTTVTSYGFFDNTKIKSEHYKELTYDDFLSRLITAVVEETENDEMFIKRAKTLINGNLSHTANYYYLDLDKDKNADMVSEWHVYNFFYAFISIDRTDNLITLIEFGVD